MTQVSLTYLFSLSARSTKRPAGIQKPLDFTCGPQPVSTACGCGWIIYRSLVPWEHKEGLVISLPLAFFGIYHLGIGFLPVSPNLPCSCNLFSLHCYCLFRMSKPWRPNLSGFPNWRILRVFLFRANPRICTHLAYFGRQSLGNELSAFSNWRILKLDIHLLESCFHISTLWSKDPGVHTCYRFQTKS